MSTTTKSTEATEKKAQPIKTKTGAVIRGRGIDLPAKLDNEYEELYAKARPALIAAGWSPEKRRQAFREAKEAFAAGDASLMVKYAAMYEAPVKKEKAPKAPKAPKAKPTTKRQAAQEEADRKEIAAVKAAPPKITKAPAMTPEEEQAAVGKYLHAHPGAKVSDLLREFRAQLSTKRALAYLDAWKKAQAGSVTAPAAASARHVRGR